MNFNHTGQPENEYTYAVDGSKLQVNHKKSSGGKVTDYVGNMIYEGGSLKRILVDGGFYEEGKYYFYLKDHLGNNRVVADAAGSAIQVTHYYPFGMSFTEGYEKEAVKPAKQPYKYNGKELDGENSLNWYDYEARQLAMDVPRFTSVDPKTEIYYSISPYVYCANNPVRFIDLDGRDVWEINNQGKIVNKIKDKNQDAFYMVDKNGNRTYTTDADGNKHYNSISFEYGTITDSKKSDWSRSATSFSVNSESSGAELFNFFADNTKKEYGLINTQNDGSTVMTNHKETSVSASKTAQKMEDKGQMVTSVVHNHPEPYSIAPSGFRPKDKSGDKFVARTFVPNAERYVYQNSKLVAYDGKGVIGTMSWGLVFRPSTAR